MNTSSTITESSMLVEINSGREIRAVTFSANGQDIVSGDDERVRVWRVEDTEEMAAMRTNCLAVSKDGRWIAAGTAWDGVVVWDAKTYDKVFAHEGYNDVTGVDFSPNSTRLVASFNHTATIWDVAARKQVLTLGDENPSRSSPVAVKYSPEGDQIATVTPSSIRLYDSNDGRLLTDIKVRVTPLQNNGLLWFGSHLFVVSDSKIKQIDASTGSTIAAWPVPDSNGTPCIALPKHGKFIAYSTKHTVTFWDTTTHTQLGLIQHSQDISSIALSPDSRFLAVGGDGGKITIHSLSRITDSIPLSRLHPTFREPDLQIDDIALDLWKRDDLTNAESLLTTAITKSQNPSHHVLASRALLRTRLRQWDAALVDAEMAIKVQLSAIGYIAKSIALVGKGEKYKGYRACDIAFEHFHSSHVSFLLLIKAIIVFMAEERDDAISRLDDLIATAPFYPTCYVVQAYMYLHLGNSYMESRNHKGAIQSFERAQARMQYYGGQPLFIVSLISGWRFDDLGITIRQRLCEALYAAGHVEDAGEALLKLANVVNEKVYMSRPIAEWVSDFTHRFLSAPESDGGATLNTTRYDDMPILYETLKSTIPAPILREWAKTTLASCSWRDALVAAVGFITQRVAVYQAICERLEAIDHILDAAECFRTMSNELTEHKEAKWDLEFRSRCCRKLEDLGDAAMNIQQYDEAISRYSAALSLNSTAPQGLFIQRCKAYIAVGLWAEALNDADKARTFNPLSSPGHERKPVPLHNAAVYETAMNTLEEIISKVPPWFYLEKRMYPTRNHYLNPGEARAAIRRVVQDVIRDSPRVLINTISGRLLNKSEQAAAFESLPVFNELTSSMTTRIDHARIEHDVMQYYRYGMLSHKWEDNEPLFEQVLHITVYDLEKSLTHDKLQMFCKIVRDAGLHWAWSDTCCINKANHFVLQEALVAMFKWYQGSAVTIISLCDVRSPSRRGNLMRSIWNTRAWTFQEYHASKVVRFYNRDWTLYMNLDIPNHKESPEILAEMEEATGISTRALMALRPGLDDIRQKLYLASTRETTLIEDEAHSLLGIFSVSLPVVYGEGDQALGRLLAQLLASSGDTSILAWTGKSGSFNSCLPASTTVFNQYPATHIPLAIPGAETGLHSASLDLTLVTKLHDRLSELPVPSFAGKRMKLPCIVFKLGPLLVSRGRLERAERLFRAQTAALGIVEIRTEENLSRLDPLYLIHPWIDFLLDRQPVESVIETITEESSSIGEPSSLPGPSNVTSTSTALQPPTTQFVSHSMPSFGGRTSIRTEDAASLRPPSSITQTQKEIRALRVIARLGQPFGALLLTPNPGGVAAFRRVAVESLITVEVEEITPTILNKLVDSVRVLDVL